MPLSFASKSNSNLVLDVVHSISNNPHKSKIQLMLILSTRRHIMKLLLLLASSILLGVSSAASAQVTLEKKISAYHDLYLEANNFLVESVKQDIFVNRSGRFNSHLVSGRLESGISLIHPTLFPFALTISQTV